MAEHVEHPSSIVLKGSAYYSKEFGKDFAAVADMSAISGYPNHCPQITEFTNYGTAEENAVYTPKNGTSSTHPIAPGATWVCLVPISVLSATSGADVTATSYWWPIPRFVQNP